jgi:neurotransmitter:Na+ symporter, NSS family
VNSTSRHEWGSRFAAILVTTGSAVGLGNIWKFPYMAGTQGGGGFVLLYIFCTALVGLPLLISELYIGQRGKANAIRSFENLDRPKTWWALPGWTGMVAAIVILSFYTLIGGWVLNFIALSVTNSFSQLSEPAAEQLSKTLMDSPSRQIFWQVVFNIGLALVVLQHLEKGIERWSRTLMPVFGLIIVALVVRSVFLPGFKDALAFLFVPKMSDITPSVAINALGLSFFKLSLGMGTMITYGSYLAQKENPVRIAASVAFGDMLVALVVGTMVFSVIFSYGVSPTSGPTLAFKTLPLLLGKMPGGYLFGVAFFCLMGFVALTASMSMIEVVITYATESFRISRAKITILSLTSVCIFGSLCALSTNVLADFKILGNSIFDLFDKFSSNILLPVGGIVTSLFMGWIVGQKGISQIVPSPVGQKWLLISTRFIIPIVVIAIMWRAFVA